MRAIARRGTLGGLRFVRPRLVLSAIGTVALASLSVSCGGPERAEEPGPSVDELGEHSGRVCPQQLPRDSSDRFAFGTEEPAIELPAHGDFEAAYVCTYGLGNAEESWTRTGKPTGIRNDKLQDLRDGINQLVTDEPEACASDLGPIYLIVTVREGRDLTGYAVDDFGCGSVRITDDPFVTVPGEARQSGTVNGVLHQSEELLAVATEAHRTNVG